MARVGLSAPLFSRARQWVANCGGGIAVTFAVSLPVLLAVLGVASDYAMMTKLQGELQQAADAAALAGAREIPLAGTNTNQIISIVKSYAAHKLTGKSAATDSDLETANLTVEAMVETGPSAVKVNISEAWTPFFAHFVKNGITPVRVSATARYVGNNNVCMLGLGPKKAILLDNNSRLTANNCGVFSNATDQSSLAIESGAVVKASIICGSGGVSASASATVTPDPLTDCPPVADPLAHRPPPDAAACDFNDTYLSNITRTLDPGVYCGGLVVTGNSNISLNPGTYVIKNGALEISGSATFEGKDVGFYITGPAALQVHFTMNTHISLTAPVKGAMSGLLFFEDRDLPVSLRHQITSNDARTLIGTIYFPVGALVVDARDPVADRSAYTAIIAREIELNKGPNLVLNSDYDMTDVPVPAGIAGSSQVVLSD